MFCCDLIDVLLGIVVGHVKVSIRLYAVLRVAKGRY